MAAQHVILSFKMALKHSVKWLENWKKNMSLPNEQMSPDATCVGWRQSCLKKLLGNKSDWHSNNIGRISVAIHVYFYSFSFILLYLIYDSVTFSLLDKVIYIQCGHLSSWYFVHLAAHNISKENASSCLEYISQASLHS